MIGRVSARRLIVMMRSPLQYSRLETSPPGYDITDRAKLDGINAKCGRHHLLRGIAPPMPAALKVSASLFRASMRRRFWAGGAGRGQRIIAAIRQIALQADG